MRRLFYFALLLAGSSASLFGDPKDLYSASADLESIRKELDVWDQSVRGFRSEHSFSLVSAYVLAQWHFKRFGNQVNVRRREKAVATKLQYSYHIPIYRSFGYLLGSSIGVWIPLYEGRRRSQSGFMLPGVVGGLVLNMSPGFRLTTAIDYQLERWSRLRDGAGESVSVTARVTDLLAGLEIFYKLKWAIKLEVHQRNSDLKPLQGAGGYPVDGVVNRTETWYALGYSYHLL